MGWRTIIIQSHAKLDYALNHLVVRTDEDVKRIFLEEIGTVMIATPSVAVTGVLLNALVAAKIRVIFCDKTHSPAFECQPYHLAYDSSGSLQRQLNWNPNVKAHVWQWIVREKIRCQAQLLQTQDHTEAAAQLLGYIDTVQPADVTNREGFAAKVYFNALFGKEFSRQQDNATNASLNYGYGLILAAVSREITICGALTQLGINHHQSTNPYNLSCDFMEPLRVIVDQHVAHTHPSALTPEIKRGLIDLLKYPVVIDKRKTCFDFGVSTYVKNLIDALDTSDLEHLKVVTYET